jgi:hypothetical protein
MKERETSKKKNEKDSFRHSRRISSQEEWDCRNDQFEFDSRVHSNFSRIHLNFSRNDSNQNQFSTQKHSFNWISEKKRRKEIHSWIYAIREKLQTDSLMYDNDREKVKYNLSQIKNSIFDVMHNWIIEIENDVTLKTFLIKIENYMRLHRLKRNVKKKLLIISMKSFEIVNEFITESSNCEKEQKLLTKIEWINFASSSNRSSSTFF